MGGKNRGLAADWGELKNPGPSAGTTSLFLVADEPADTVWGSGRRDLTRLRIFVTRPPRDSLTPGRGASHFFAFSESSINFSSASMGVMFMGSMDARSSVKSASF